MIPKYVVFNINKEAELVASGNDLYQLLSVYHGKAYQITKVKMLSDREEW